MKNWNELSIQEQIAVVVYFIKGNRDKFTTAEQCSLEHYLYRYAQRVRYGNNPPLLVSVNQLDAWLVDDGFEIWFNNNFKKLSKRGVFDATPIDETFWKEGWIVTTNMFTKVERIDEVESWAFDNELPFIPNQLDNDLDAVELAKKHGFEFDDRTNPTRVTRPYFSK